MSLINDVDLLTFDDLKIFCLSKFPGEKAEALCKHLKKYMIIKNKKLYVIRPNITYEYFDNDKEKITQFCTKYVETSFKSIKRAFLSSNDDDVIEKFQSLEKKIEAKNTFENAYFEKLLPQIKHEITNNNVVFDINLDEIHFENGFMNLKTKEFKPRDKTLHFVTCCINRNYEPSAEEHRTTINNIFKKIYPGKGDFECVKMIIASGLSGRSIKDCEMLFLLGAGSGGKSLSLQFTQQAIDCYFQELNSDTFSFEAGTSNKSDKIMNTFADKPFVRIAWINELKDVRMNESLFKAFCEGILQTCKLFKEGDHEITHMAKPIITANTMPIFKNDTGMVRRIRAHTHRSLFVDDKSECNEKAHIYLKDKNLLENIKTNNSLKNAWFDILAESCSKWLGGEKNVFTENFMKTKADICDINDDNQDLINSKLIITNNVEDRIGKIAMAEIYKNLYPNKMKTAQTLLANLKEKKIVYDGQIRTDNVRGCYVGVKLRETIKYNECDPWIEDVDIQQLYLDALEEIKLLKKRLNTKNLDSDI